MRRFCFFCITYGGDYRAFVSMIESFKKHNVDKIPFVIAVQDESIKIPYGGGSSGISHGATFEDFKRFEDSCIKVIKDSDFAYPYLIKEKREQGLSAGYLNQEITKLTFFYYGYARHYLCIDSDSVFIRDFYLSDFFYDDITPYIVLVQDKDLHAKSYYCHFAMERKRYIKKIFDFVGCDDRRYRTCHNNQILSCEVLSSFSDFMKARNLSFVDLLDIAPFEFTWYNAYFQKVKLIKEVAIEPFFKMYHTKAEFMLDVLSGNDISNLKGEYIGYILNSNWSKGDLGFKKRGMFGRISYLFLTKFT